MADIDTQQATCSNLTGHPEYIKYVRKIMILHQAPTGKQAWLLVAGPGQVDWGAMSTAVSVETLKGQESELPAPAMFQIAKDSNAPSSPFSETSSPIPIAPDAPAQSGAPSSLLSPRQALPVDECMGGLSGIDHADWQASVTTAGESLQLYLLLFAPSTIAPKRLWAFMPWAYSMRVRSTPEGPAKRMFKHPSIPEWYGCKASSAASHAPDVA